MCGIAGIFRTDGGSIDASRVVRMRDAMAYRGPDASGLSQGRGFVLGHRRLSIIDLSDQGKQPMTNEDGSIEVVLNGEIYNFADLRPELERNGHRFRSRTDTEVLLHGYEHWGIRELLARIRGMYAFAIVDRQRHELHLARDPLGKKPLFFCLAGNELAFASSARALAEGLSRIPEVNPASIDCLLTYSYIPGPGTIFRGVEKLPPGHGLSLGKDGKRSEFVHWAPDFLHAQEDASEQEWLDRTEDVLLKAVRRRMVADVPLGILLSGGVDSSLIAAMVARLAPETRCFSVANEDKALDESRFARIVAEHCGLVHEVLPVDGNFRSRLIPLIMGMGEPLADASAINVCAIAEKARQFVTVVLTGDGGDEGFGGYSQFFAYYYAGRLRKFSPGPIRFALGAAGEILKNTHGDLHRAGTLFRLASKPLEETLFAEGWLPPSLRSALYTQSFRNALGATDVRQHYFDALPPDACATAVDRVMQTRLLTILPDDYLAKVDGGTMGFNLEARSPFLDVEVVELGMRIPARVRFRNGEPKSVLRRLARRHLPKECIDRPKQGFVAPVGMWLRREWTDLLDELVLGPHVEQRGWFRRDALQQLVAEHRSMIDHAYLLWALMVLELWLRMVEGQPILKDAMLETPQPAFYR
jgi:asparagine synthase (glutamine-hydrolysing)